MCTQPSLCIGMFRCVCVCLCVCVCVCVCKCQWAEERVGLST